MKKKTPSAAATTAPAPLKGFAGRAPLADLHEEITVTVSQEELRKNAAEHATNGTLPSTDVKEVLEALPKRK